MLRDRMAFLFSIKVVHVSYHFHIHPNNVNNNAAVLTEYGTALTNILPILFLYLNTVTVTAGTFEP